MITDKENKKIKVQELSDEEISTILSALTYYRSHSKDVYFIEILDELEEKLEKSRVFYGGTIWMIILFVVF